MSADAGDIDANLCSASVECDDGFFCNGREECDPGAIGANAMGCLRGPDPCAATDVCMEATDECRDPCGMLDRDGDGQNSLDCGGLDCDDGDARRFNGNPEVCDALNVDEDCDPLTFGEKDTDGDGFLDAACCNMGTCGNDCDDSEAGTFPGAEEICGNEIDENCNGSVDDEC